MNLQEQFDFATEQVRLLQGGANGPTDDEKLNMYALYKQATVGDCNESEKPNMIRFEARAKWNAWSAKYGTSKKDAMREYCNNFLALSDKYMA